MDIPPIGPAEVRRLAIETGVADPDLSTGDQLVTDYGDATEDIMTFASAIARSRDEMWAKRVEEARSLLAELFALAEREGVFSGDYRGQLHDRCAAAIRQSTMGDEG